MINRCTPQVAAAALLSPPHAPPLNPLLVCSYIKEGKIVPVEVTVGLLSKAIFNSPNWHFLVDGFPRNMDNFNGWFDAIGDECDVRAPSPSSAPPAHAAAGAGTVCAALHLPPERHGTTLEAQAPTPPPPTFFRCRCPSKFCPSCCSRCSRCIASTARTRACSCGVK
jgi:hypothetical protein